MLVRGVLVLTTGGLGICSADDNDKVTRLQNLQVSMYEAEMDATLRFCDTISRLEQMVDATGGLEAPGAEAYEQQLSDWRAHWRGGQLQPSCRIDSLGESLYKAAGRMTSNHAAWNLTGQWAAHMRSLADKETRLQSCREFARFHENGWLPPIWKWAETTPGLDGAILEELLRDPEYESYYAPAAGRALAYGSPAVETLHLPEGRFRRKRIQELQHFRILRRAAGINVQQLTHIVEFGGGAGETVAALRDLGFSGKHLVIDLPPMLLLQRYWLRFSGLPAYLAEDLPGRWHTAPLRRNGVLLMDSTGKHHTASRMMADADAATTLFLGFWSFTEASTSARERIWPLLARCGIMMLTFGNNFDGIDNAQYLQQELLNRGFHRTHYALSWHLEVSVGFFYLLAVRKDVGEVSCLPSLNCKDLTRHSIVAQGFAFEERETEL
ncbi:unnamed protein product [Effrenium voratum]|nr:unnamed protein product [Effrenium voratum]